jgi:hypothetical protein
MSFLYKHLKAKLFFHIGGNILLFLWIYSFAIKVRNIEAFKLKLARSPIIHQDWILILSYTITILELCAIFLLCFSKLRDWGLYLSFFLLSLFTIYLIILINHPGYSPCGCAGIFEALPLSAHILLNIFVMILNLLLVIFPIPIEIDLKSHTS